MSDSPVSDTRLEINSAHRSAADIQLCEEMPVFGFACKLYNASPWVVFGLSLKGQNALTPDAHRLPTTNRQYIDSSLSVSSVGAYSQPAA